MPRPVGSKNKSKTEQQLLQFQSSPDILKLAEVATLFRVSQSEIKRQIRAREIPEDCYFKIGTKKTRYRFYKAKLEQLSKLSISA